MLLAAFFGAWQLLRGVGDRSGLGGDATVAMRLAELAGRWARAGAR